MGLDPGVSVLLRYFLEIDLTSEMCEIPWYHGFWSGGTIAKITWYDIWYDRTYRTPIKTNMCTARGTRAYREFFKLSPIPYFRFALWWWEWMGMGGNGWPMDSAPRELSNGFRIVKNGAMLPKLRAFLVLNIFTS